MNKARLAMGGLTLGGLVVLTSMIPACATVHTETKVEASREEVWAVLSDEGGYKEWNPVLVPHDGEKLEEGKKVKYTMTGPGTTTSEVSSTVNKRVKNELLNQSGGIWGVITFDHTWRLEETEGGTKVIQHEEYRGVYVPFWDLSWVEPAYAAAGAALKARVEKRKKDKAE